MAANKILSDLKAFAEFTQTGFKYNLQTFPDTFLGATFLFSVLFQSAPLATLGTSIVLLNLLHPVLGGFLSQVIGGTLGTDTSERCSGHFPGVSYERLIGATDNKSYGELSSTSWPSYYTMFLGFLVSYIGSLPFIYSKEIEASPRRKVSTTIGMIVLGIVVVTCLVYRILSSCDTFAGSVIGLAGGALVGFICVGFAAYLSERRLTNILSFPLMRSRAADGKPIYVCQK